MSVARGARTPRSSPPATPARPVVETLHGVTLTDRYRWLENGKDASVEAWTPRAARGNARTISTASAPPFPGMRDEITRYYRPRPHATRRSSSMAANSSSARARASRRRSSTRGSTARKCCCSTRWRSTRRARRRLGAVVPNRDASRLAVGIYAEGSEIQDFRDHRHATGAQIGPMITGCRQFQLGARRALRVHLAAHARSRTRSRSRTAAIAIGSAADRRDRRAADPDGGREELLRGLRAGGAPIHGVRDRRFLVEHDPHPAHRVDRRAADDLHERQVPGAMRIFRKDRIYFRTNHDAPNWKLMAASYANARVRRLDDADPGAEDGARRCRRHRTAGSSRSDREDVLTRLSRLRPRRQARARSRAARVRQRDRASATTSTRIRVYATTRVAHRAVHAVRARRQGARLEARLAGRPAARPRRDRRRSASMSTAKDGAKIPVFIVHRKDLKRTATIRRCSTATAASTSRVEPYYLGSYASVRQPRRRVRRRRDPRRHRVRRDAGTSRRCSRASRTTFDDMIAVAEWLIAREVHAAGEARDRRRQQRRPARSARCSRSAPTSSARRSARCRCSTWCATTSS